MTRVKLSHDAERDLIDIYLFGLEHFGVRQAERYLERISSKIELAADNPSFGADYGSVTEGLRRYEVVSHAVYYRSTPSGILVLRILHGHMDPGRHLG